MGKEWDANTIGRVFGIIDEALYSMALNSEINPSERDDKIFDPYLRKFWQTKNEKANTLSRETWVYRNQGEKTGRRYLRVPCTGSDSRMAVLSQQIQEA